MTLIVLCIEALRTATVQPFIRPTPAAALHRAVHQALFSTKGGQISPPVARREEDRVVYAGVAPPGRNMDILRQPEYSKEKLMDPPVPVPDPYGWLRDDSRTNEEILNHLRAENEYSEKLTEHLEGLRKTLYDEMLSSIQETDYTVPRPKGSFYHYSRTFEGKSYATYCRAPRTDGELSIQWNGSAESPILPGEQIKLDVNELAKGRDYCAVGSVTQSSSEKLLAYTVDFKGDEQCELFIKDMDTGKVIDRDPDNKMYGRVLWGNDDSTIFYLKLDETLRPYQVYRRTVGGKAADDELLYEENDQMFWTEISKSLDERFLFVEMSSTETSEIWYLDLNDENASLQCIAKRRIKVLYDVEHRDGHWWITSNVGETPNMRLFTASAKANCADEWHLVEDPNSGLPLFDGQFERALHGVSAFSNHVVAEGREEGMPRAWILSIDKDRGNKVKNFHRLNFPEAAHDAGLSVHYEFDVDHVSIDAHISLYLSEHHLKEGPCDFHIPAQYRLLLPMIP